MTFYAINVSIAIYPKVREPPSGQFRRQIVKKLRIVSATLIPHDYIVTIVTWHRSQLIDKIRVFNKAIFGDVSITTEWIWGFLQLLMERKTNSASLGLPFRSVSEIARISTKVFSHVQNYSSAINIAMLPHNFEVEDPNDVIQTAESRPKARSHQYQVGHRRAYR